MDRLRKVHRLSLVIPVFNERGSLLPLMAELAAALASLKRDAEIIWVDDGSTDGSLDELQLMKECRSVRVIHVPSRSGQSVALWIGLQLACGDVIVTLDGDGQNDPADIPLLLRELEGADMVVGWRKDRRDPLRRCVFANLANAARNMLTSSRIPDSGCALRAFRREVLASLIPFEGMHRFLPTLAEIGGFRVKSVAVNHRRREWGQSKYGICDRLMAPLLDCLMLRRLKRRRLSKSVWRELEPGVELDLPFKNQSTQPLTNTPVRNA